MPLTKEEQSVNSQIIECLSEYDREELTPDQYIAIGKRAFSLFLQSTSLLSKNPKLRNIVQKSLMIYKQFDFESANFIIILNQLRSILENIHMRDDYVA
jgi:hypothetical protein